jgi:hypothetical protein
MMEEVLSKTTDPKTPLEELGTPDGAVLEEAWSEYRRRKGEQYPHHCISWKIVLDSAH